jgi:single-stranded-DNA-specific exonuclease
MSAAARSASKSALRTATTLVNAPRRSSTGDATPALELLLRASSAADVASGVHAETAALEAARVEVAAEVARARKVAPRFAGDVALLQVRSRCQVHPLVAQTWAQRLRTSIVIAANDGYRDGYVHFAVRSATGADLVTYLADHAPPAARTDMQFGGGHAQASGGALPLAVWQALLRNLGFAPDECGAAVDGTVLPTGT